MNEELKKLAEKYNWKLEVQHGEYKGILCGVQVTNLGEEPLPLYRFPGGISLAQHNETMIYKEIRKVKMVIIWDREAKFI